MKISHCLATLTLATVFAVSPPASVQAQQPTYITPIEMKGQWLRGSVGVTQHENDGMIGINGKGGATGYKVEAVRQDGPAAGAGILPGDIIVAMDGASIKGLDTLEALKPIVQKKDGEIINFTIDRNGQSNTIGVTVWARKHLLANDADWQNEGKFPPAIAQLILADSASVTATLSQMDRHPNSIFLYLYLYSKNAPSFIADDLKFFVLDGTNQQLRHVSLEEIKYGIQLEVAHNWKGGNYPPPAPPSPQRQYTIAGVENGNYTIANLGGGIASISGASSSTYTVTQQPDYSQLGYSLGLAIRQYRDAKSNQKLAEQAKQAIASWEQPYFKSQAPIVAGENRNGGIMYWTGSTRRPQPPYRVILFINDPRTQKEEHVTFAFGSGAEKIKQETENQEVGTSTRPKIEGSLTNRDIVEMVKAGLAAEIIVAKIKTASCSFETSPTVLKELKEAGVPDKVILAMIEAPK
jgi:hypothetical protein